MELRPAEARHQAASSAGCFGADLFDDALIAETFILFDAAGCSRPRYERENLLASPRRVGTRRRLSTSPGVETRQARSAAHPRQPRGWITRHTFTRERRASSRQLARRHRRGRVPKTEWSPAEAERTVKSERLAFGGCNVSYAAAGTAAHSGVSSVKSAWSGIRHCWTNSSTLANTRAAGHGGESGGELVQVR